MNQYAVYLLVAGVVLGLGALVITLAFRAAKKQGAAEVERDVFQTKADQAGRANAIDEEVARLSDDDLDSELRNGR